MSGRFSLTVAIDYPNGAPHIGHAYEKVAGDAIARFWRLCGRDVFFVAGNDEHSVNVMRMAAEQGLTPQAYCDQMAGVFRDAWNRLGVSYTEFMQTSDPRHEQAVQSLVQRLYDNGYVYRGTYAGWYCNSCEAFYTEKDVPDRTCPVHKRPVEHIEEDNYFFRLTAFRDPIREHILSHPDFVRPATRRNEVLSFLESGLEDVSISRARSRWGVPVPWDPSQTVYVWFDALITYLSAMGYGWDEERFSRYWPADLHLIGKDIIRFHCIIWPAMLMGAGLPLPRSVFVHGFQNIRGEKLSKTTGNVIDPVRFVDLYGVDQTRYYLLAETPFGQDGNIAPETFVKRVNSDLANDLGNLLSRTTAMIGQFWGGVVPEPAERDGVLATLAGEAMAEAKQAFEELRLHDACAAVWRLIRRANKYIDEEAPWDLAKDPSRRGRLATVLYALAETLRVVAVALQPILLEAPKEIWRQLGLSPDDLAKTTWADTAWGGMRPGARVQRGAPLFPRLDAEEVVRKAEGFGPPRSEDVRGPEPAVPEVALDDFRRLDLRVVDILSAERVPGTDRLLRLRVRLDGEEREVVSGIAQHYRPEELVGRQAVLVANLKPARIRGIESRGMLLAASSGDELALVQPARRMPPGSVVK